MRATRSNGCSTTPINTGALQPDTTNAPPAILRSSSLHRSACGCVLMNPHSTACTHKGADIGFGMGSGSLLSIRALPVSTRAEFDHASRSELVRKLSRLRGGPRWKAKRSKQCRAPPGACWTLINPPETHSACSSAVGRSTKSGLAIVRHSIASGYLSQRNGRFRSGSAWSARFESCCSETALRPWPFTEKATTRELRNRTNGRRHRSPTTRGEPRFRDW
jgi:hypothetical protein